VVELSLYWKQTQGIVHGAAAQPGRGCPYVVGSIGSPIKLFPSHLSDISDRCEGTALGNGYLVAVCFITRATQARRGRCLHEKLPEYRSTHKALNFLLNPYPKLLSSSTKLHC
jgi:hypothetical protein